MTDKKHFIMKSLRLTEQEAKVLADKSKKMNMSEASYLRLLITQKPNDYPEIRKLLKKLIYEINHIGVNVNQIVHHHNYELYSEKDREQLIAYMRKLNNAVKEVAECIGNQ